MIFGIGLGRTGTRSLTDALRLMGLNAVHWDDRGSHVMDHWHDSDLALPEGLDVNTGADTSPAAGLKANIAAARDLPRQLRLRGLGGQIVVDFAPMPKRDRAAVEQQLRAAFRGEAAETSLAGWTPLGMFEIQRKRDRLPLAELLRGTAP